MGVSVPMSQRLATIQEFASSGRRIRTPSLARPPWSSETSEVWMLCYSSWHPAQK